MANQNENNANWDALDEAGLIALARKAAFFARPGMTFALSGDLGAGKTTFARAFIRAVLGNEAEEVPSPTFTLVQTYAGARYEVAHYDLYRLNDADELGELGLDLALEKGIAIIEWPERAGPAIPEDRIEIALSDAEDGRSRNVEVRGNGSNKGFGARLRCLGEVLDAAGFGGTDTSIAYLQGDASVRAYARAQRADGVTALVMDWPRQPDGPAIRDGLPYSRIAHLAEDVGPFIGVAALLRAAGLSAPEIYAADCESGILVLEDLGGGVYGGEVANGKSQRELWQAATDVLVALRGVPLPGAEAAYSPPPYDERAMRIETELVVDWAWPAIHGEPAPDVTRQSFAAAWRPLLADMSKETHGWVLRDYHSPNLIHLPDRTGLRRVGLIDFQDAVAGPAAYDLVSLLQDARLDVPEELESELLARYCERARASEPGFDEEAFRYAYAVLGAQRNTKILGIFARLAKRDGKPQYLAHVPRIWGYLERNLRHRELSSLKTWYDAAFPVAVRGRMAAG